MTNLILYLSAASYLTVQSTSAARGSSGGGIGGVGGGTSGGTGGTGGSSGSSNCYDDQGRVVNCTDRGLDTGEIVGTVIGVVAFLAIAVGVFLLVRKEMRKKAAAETVGNNALESQKGQ